MIKMVLLDLDGTLLTDDKQISNDTLLSLKKAINKGVRIVIATGRPFNGVKRVIERLGYENEDAYVICFNGCLIYSLKEKKAISMSNITGKDIKAIFNDAWALNSYFHAFRDNQELIANCPNDYTDIERTINEIPVTYMDINEVKDEDIFLKCMAVCKPETMVKIIEPLKKKYSSSFNVVLSAPYFLEFVNKFSSKGNALITLAKYLGIKPEETMAFGDASNDCDMISKAGIGVAMGNATDDAKECADFITKTNNEDGVAYAIKKFVLNTR